MIFPKIALAQGVIQLLKKYSIQHIVISPGSRNAPLTIGFNADPYFNCYSIVDERCAAFFGLGLAQQQKQPVALVCTSGSALLNYYPAIAEAFYSQIPLLILSADRPLSKIDIGDGQTIRQQNVFENHSLYNANLSEKWNSENNDLINQAIHQAIFQKGPVHINIPFEEPLYQTTPELSVVVTPQSKTPLQTIIQQREWNECVDIWENATKKLILIGSNVPYEISEEVIQQWANDPSVLVITEANSNCNHSQFVSCIDQLITPFDTRDIVFFQPDILITLGGMVVSKRIKSILRNHNPNHHWHIDPLRAYDTYGCLSKHIAVHPNDFFTELEDRISEFTNSDYQSYFLNLKALRQQKHNQYMDTVPYSDLFVFKTIFNQLPKDYQLQLSNSSTIRYAQLFDIDPSIEIFCNRGTSGIDGSTSTAIGAAIGSSKPTLFVTGDISFFYDSNALWNTYIPSNFKIIIINNSGGGIFRILPGHQETPTFNTYFETQHQLNASHLAAMYQFNYTTATEKSTLITALPLFLKSESRSILEIFTPTTVNDKVLLDYFDRLE